MLNITLPELAVSVSSAGGLGFVAAGFDVSNLEIKLQRAADLVKQDPKLSGLADNSTITLPVGVGFINWGADIKASIAAIKKYRPCAVWFFGAKDPSASDLIPWAQQARTVTSGLTRIWVQVGSLAEALSVAETIHPDVLVVQGSDAGGHGLARSASVISLVPEVCDALAHRQLYDITVLAAGGIVDARGVAAALALGASGVAMGTRFLASKEASIAHGYQAELLRVSDGGNVTVRSTVYDSIRGIKGWPERYDGRGIINQSYIDAVEGHMRDQENKRLYEEELKKGDAGWGPQGRLTTYAGTGVGIVKETLPAGDIVERILAHLKAIGYKHPASVI